MNDQRTRTQPSQQRTQPTRQEQKPQQQEIPVAGAGDQAPAVYKLPEPIARRGISEEQWRTLKDNLYPGATNDSCLMVWDYCKARGLDPMKKPCHIVPMEVTVKERAADGRMTERKEWRDVVMPGIYEYRTTAHRTGLYLGHEEPVYGEFVDSLGVSEAPEWCLFVVLKWNEKAQRETKFPVCIYFDEICATKRDGNNGYIANARWKKAPIQMLTKCAEAAALREAFPEELGGSHTDDEMEGRVIGEDSPAIVTGKTHTDIAAEALRARMGKPKPDDRVVAQQSKPKEPQAEVPRAAEVPRGTPEDEKIPWEQVDKPDAEWIKDLRACTSMDAIQHVWANFLDSNADRTADYIEIESVMHYMAERLGAPK